jgi:hypothetical protein
MLFFLLGEKNKKAIVQETIGERLPYPYRLPLVLLPAAPSLVMDEQAADDMSKAAKRRKLEDESCDVTDATAATGECLPKKSGGKSAACLRMREKILAVERDYTHYFALDVGGEAGADQYVYQHFNTLCVVGIAPSSIAFSGRKVIQVDFDVGRGGDKNAANKPSGKKKHGAMYGLSPSACAVFFANCHERV